MDYSGKIITKNAVTPTQTAASGVWTLDDALQAQKGNNWPIPGVPNPISKSLRFNSADSAYLNRTPAIAGNRKTWTWSAWVKRSSIGAISSTSNSFICAGTNTSDDFNFYFRTEDTIDVLARVSSSVVLRLITTQVFRDVSAWYHIVLAIDTTQATSSNRAKLYVNGSQVTALSTATYPSQNQDLTWNNSVPHDTGRLFNQFGASSYFNGYMTEINFVDGQALTPSDFGMTDTNTGVWIPKKYTGTYGTNGFYVNFKDATNTTTIGYDYSGNGNNWNANNFSVTAGAGNDSLTDVPTPWVGYGLNSEAGGVVRGNYATLNPIASLPGGTGSATWSNGNLNFAPNQAEGSTQVTAISTIICPSSGKWYWEVTPTTLATASSSRSQIGIMNVAALNNTFTSAASTTGAYAYVPDGSKTSSPSNTVYTGYGASYTTNDVIGVALNMDAGTLTFYKNGVSQGTAFSGLSGEYFPAVGFWITAVINFGQRPFAYTAPSGFKALCTTNLPTPTIGATSSTRADDYFNIALYTGNNSTNAITGLGFSPDLVWIKSRSNAENNLLFDTNRGRGYGLYSNLTNAEAGPSPSDKDLVSFDSDGFTLGQIYNFNVNDSGKTFVGWAWRGSDSAAVSNTAGSITSTVSANTTAGFSIVTYTGNSTNSTVGHGLGAAPSMVIVKTRSNVDGWYVYHTSIGNTKYLRLNTTAAEATFNLWQNTNPTSTVFSISTDATVNQSGYTYVAYCFAQVAGYSAFGSYTGNANADGPFIYTGFAPAFVMYKRTDVADSWVIKDNKRFGYNLNTARIYPNQSLAEDTSTNGSIDLLSNGFKHRSANDLGNQTGGTYIYMALAENPFKYSLAR